MEHPLHAEGQELPVMNSDSIGPSSRGCHNTLHLIQLPAILSECLQSMRKFEIQAYSVFLLLFRLVRR